MTQGVVARRYAKALIRLAEKQKVSEATGKHLAEISDSIKSSQELQEALESNKVPFVIKQKILGQVLTRIESPVLVRTFSLYLLTKRRFELLSAIAIAFEQLLQEQLGQIEAKVSVTHELSEASIKKMEKTLSLVTGKQVQVETSIDPSLIGGIVTRIGSTVFDGSIRNQLNQIRQSISQGGTI